jgi:hypothetical protein
MEQYEDEHNRCKNPYAEAMCVTPEEVDELPSDEVICDRCFEVAVGDI